MQLFYEPIITENTMQLSDENQRHIVQVLRMQIADQLQLTDGKGMLCTATISDISKKKCSVIFTDLHFVPNTKPAIHLAIAFTKNNSRMEWLLEKITEIGVATIYPLQTKRTEQVYPKKDRLQHILVSAMCQSKQYYLPQLHNIITLDKLLQVDNSKQKMIAHCIENTDKKSILQIAQPNESTLILIGPEGDFTAEEIELCIQQNCQPITLGQTRLRTETAGMVAITLLNSFY